VYSLYFRGRKKKRGSSELGRNKGNRLEFMAWKNSNHANLIYLIAKKKESKGCSEKKRK